MMEWLTSLGGAVIPVIAVAGGLLVAIVGIIAGAWQKNRQVELEISLKHDMLNRGMSAEEIERVLKASHKS